MQQLDARRWAPAVVLAMATMDAGCTTRADAADDPTSSVDDDSGDVDACPAAGCLDLDGSDTLRGELIVLFGRGDGSFEAPREFEFTPSQIVALPTADGAELVGWSGDELCRFVLGDRALTTLECLGAPAGDAALFDVIAHQADDDPAPELAVLLAGEGAQSVYRGDLVDGELKLIPYPEPLPIVDYGGAAVADFDSDGYEEIFVSSIDSGRGVLSSWIDPGGNPAVLGADAFGHVVAGRFDDDGIVDLFAGDRFFAGHGTELPTEGLHALAGVSVPLFAAAAQLDGDARTELVMASATASGLQVLDAPFVPGAESTTDVDVAGHDLVAGDLDGDGIDEVLSTRFDAYADASPPAGTLHTLWLELTRFAPASETAQVERLCDACTLVDSETLDRRRRAVLADLDGDGALDYAVVVRRR